MTSARALSPIPSLIPSHHRPPHTLSRRGPRHRHCVHAPREPRGVQHGRVCAHSMGLQYCGALVSGCLPRMPTRHFSIVVGTRAKRERAHVFGAGPSGCDLVCACVRLCVYTRVVRYDARISASCLDVGVGCVVIIDWWYNGLSTSTPASCSTDSRPDHSSHCSH